MKICSGYLPRHVGTSFVQLPHILNIDITLLNIFRMSTLIKYIYYGFKKLLNTRLNLIDKFLNYIIIS